MLLEKVGKGSVPDIFLWLLRAYMIFAVFCMVIHAIFFM